MKTGKVMVQCGLASLLLVAATAAQAFGLGNLELQSQLNQRLNANIAVIIADDVDPADLNIRLAEDKHFERAGLKRTQLVNDLMFSPKRTAEGQMVISVSSRSRIIEPMLSFVLEVEQGEVTTVKRYTVMLPAPE